VKAQKQIVEQGSGGAQRQEMLTRAYSFADLSAYSFKDRLLIRAADLVFYLVIGLIGRTVRFEVESWEPWEATLRNGHLAIGAFWHEGIFLSTYFWRRHRFVVMTSQSRDGEYIARFIQRFGYGVARGSATRGGVTAGGSMARLMDAGCPAAFTADGPKGPAHKSKMGPVLLARETGHPINPFTIVPLRCWRVRTWDRLQVPKPFTRAVLIGAPPIYVAADADGVALREKRDELQHALEELDRRGEEWRRAHT
jgi:lysophospholipid acyltransferase (LPLAT)-like uncharacterized protein